LLRPALEAAGFTVDHSAAGLYLWVTRGQDCWDTLGWLAQRGILAAPGAFYGPAGHRHVRVSLTATDERVAAAATRLPPERGARVSLSQTPSRSMDRQVEADGARRRGHRWGDPGRRHARRRAGATLHRGSAERDAARGRPRPAHRDDPRDAGRCGGCRPGLHR